jgi:hypothetical protein
MDPWKTGGLIEPLTSYLEAEHGLIPARADHSIGHRQVDV